MSIELIGALLILAGLFPPWILVRRGFAPTHPLILVWISQLVPLGVALLNLTGDVPVFRPATWLVLSGSFCAILMGCAVGTVAARQGIHRPARELSPRRLGIGVAVLAIAYFLSIGQGIHQAGGLPLLLPSPDRARLAFMTGRLQNILFAAAIPLLILAFHYARISGKLWQRIAVAMVLLAMMGTYLLIGSRFLTLVWLSMLLVYWDQNVGRLRIGRIVLVLVVFILLFSIVGYFRYGKLLAATSGSTRLLKVGAILALQSVYSYIANAYWNLDYALHQYNLGLLNLPTWGISTNEGVLWILGVLPGLQKAYSLTNALNADVALREGLNSTPYHWTLFKDFGILGPFLGSFGMGVAFTYLHGRYCRSGAPGPIMVYGLLAYFVLGSFNLMATVIPTPIFGMALLVGTIFLSSVPRAADPLPEPPREPGR